MARSKPPRRGRLDRWLGRGEGGRKPFFSPAMRRIVADRGYEAVGFLFGTVAFLMIVAIVSYNPADPSLNSNGGAHARIANILGAPGAWFADVAMQGVGFAAYIPPLLLLAWGWRLSLHKPVRHPFNRILFGLAGLLLASAALAGTAAPDADPLAPLPGGGVGILLSHLLSTAEAQGLMPPVAAGTAGIAAAVVLFFAAGVSIRDWIAGLWGLIRLIGRIATGKASPRQALQRLWTKPPGEAADEAARDDGEEEDAPASGPRIAPVFDPIPVVAPARVTEPIEPPKIIKGVAPPRRTAADAAERRATPELPPLDLLQAMPANGRAERPDDAALQRRARDLEGVLSEFGVRGGIQRVHPGPVVTLYELEPAPGTKSSRVIGLADDVARSMSAVSARIAVVPGRNAIGIELPNIKRETVYLRDLLSSDACTRAQGKLMLALGKDIGGQPVMADLSRFPHLLVAGTTGSGKSVAINTMILSLLYRLPPDRCRFIMVDPKMLELSVYDGIPHLLTPVVTDPKKAVVALKWTVREMEERYRAMAKLGVRNIEGYNARLREARVNGESLTRRVQTGFDPDTGKPLFEEQPLDLTELPYIVVIVDEMADLMLVAGKDIEAAIQRLAQMARAAGIHLVMATQRPSVDVITGTIKANFPTRISFQVTTKIDSRTILGEQGAEQLLGQGDMLYMAGGGRITRVHGPFVSDDEVEQVVRFLKAQGEPAYVEAITQEEEDEEPGENIGGTGGGNADDDLYDRAVALVCRERRGTTSFIQRQLRIGYNSAARLIERMEAEGVVSKPNHAGKRDVLARNTEER
jgi:DNA segregation ATPase FtsK/SpoIIIE, S-DNA-T family